MKKVLALLFALAPSLALAQNAGWPPPAGAIAFLCVYNLALPTLTTGQVGFIQCDQHGQLLTSGGGGGGGLSVTDQTSWIQGTSAFTPGGGVFNDTATLSSGQEGTYRLTTKRAVIADVDASGNQLHSDLIAPINGLSGSAQSATNPMGWTYPAASTTGGATPYHLVAANTTNSTNIKNGAGTVYSIQTANISGLSPVYLKFYDKATAPTCNSDTVVKTIAVPANTLVGGNNASFRVGVAFTSGIGICLTNGIADNDNAAVATATSIVNIDYK